MKTITITSMSGTRVDWRHVPQSATHLIVGCRLNGERFYRGVTAADIVPMLVKRANLGDNTAKAYPIINGQVTEDSNV